MAEDCQTVENSASASQFEPSVALNGDAQNELVDEEEKENKDKKKRNVKIGTFWNKPPLKIYADNFGFVVNGYQCMIDYLDGKDYSGIAKKENIRLPFLEERCLRSYSSKKPFKFYENAEIDDFIDKGEKIRDQIRQNDVVSPGNVLRRTHTNWSMTTKYVQLVKKSNVLDYRKLREQAELESRGIVVPKVLQVL